MKIKSLIKEEEPTINGRIYPKGSLLKIKEALQPRLDTKSVFVALHGIFDMWIKAWDRKGDEAFDILNHEDLPKFGAGIVTSFEVKDGQAELEIFVFDDEIGTALQRYLACFNEEEIKADFYLVADKNKDGIVDLTFMKIAPVIGLVCNHESNN